jgi:hypothetical protein
VDYNNFKDRKVDEFDAIIFGSPDFSFIFRAVTIGFFLFVKIQKGENGKPGCHW